MRKKPIILVAALAVLAWVLAAAPVEAGGRKFGHAYGHGIRQHYDEHVIQWRGHSTYPGRYQGTHLRRLHRPPTHHKRFYHSRTYRHRSHYNRHRYSRSHHQQLHLDLLLGLLYMTVR